MAAPRPALRPIMRFMTLSFNLKNKRYSQRTNGSNISVGEGVPYGSPNNKMLGPAHCHIPLCIGAAGPVLRYTLNRYCAPSHSRLKDLVRLAARVRDRDMFQRSLLARSRDEVALQLPSYLRDLNNFCSIQSGRHGKMVASNGTSGPPIFEIVKRATEGQYRCRSCEVLFGLPRMLALALCLHVPMMIPG